MFKASSKICDVGLKMLDSVGACIFTQKRFKASNAFDYERVKGTENAKWLHLTGKQSIGKFIPVTRKTLLKRILEDSDVIERNSIEDFQRLATGVDSAVTIHYKKKLEALKVYIT